MRRPAMTVLAIAMGTAFALGCASTQTAAVRSVPTDSGVKGTVKLKGAPAEGAFVYAYTSPEKSMRGPTKMLSGPSSPDGGYSLNLPPGTYYIIARQRASGQATGLLMDGDFEAKYPGNPVTVKAGRFADVNLTLTDLPGTFLLAPYAHQGGEMGFRGRVFKEDGTPFSDAFVLVYTQRDRIGRPLFLSKPTDENGEYVIYVKKPGTYYVAARAAYGALPRKGEAYGTYDVDPEHKVELKEKTILTGIDITMQKFSRDLTKCAEH